MCLLRFTACATFCLLAMAAGAQTDSPTPKPPEKQKHVWTNDEVEDLHGGISVVGEPTKEKKPGSAADAKTPAGPPKKKAESCDSDAWAVGVDAMMRSWEVSLGKKFWAERLFQGLCMSPVNFADAGKQIGGDYVLDDGKKIRVKADVALHDFPSPTLIVNAVRESHPFLVSWKNQAMVVTFIDYI